MAYDKHHAVPTLAVVGGLVAGEPLTRRSAVTATAAMPAARKKARHG